MAKLITKTGNQEGLEIGLTKGRTLLGRADDADIVISDINVSRHHAEILVLDGLFAIRDLNSSNGVYVDDTPVARSFLRDGNEVRLGETIFVFSAEGEQVRDYTGAPPASEFRPRPGGPGGEIDALHRTEVFRSTEDMQGEQLKEVNAKLRSLYQVFHEIASAPSLREVFEAVGRTLAFSIGVERVTFFLAQEKLGGPWQRYHAYSAADLSSLAQGSAECEDLLERARNEDRTILAHIDAKGVPHFEEKEANAAAAPVRRADKIAAVIYIDNPESGKALSKPDVEFINAVALQVGIRFRQVEQVRQLRTENIQLRQMIEEDSVIVVVNEKMKQLMSICSRIGESDSNVLITGESGTGKELIAKSIHKFSRRGAKPLVAVNCAALPETLLESELFGHEKGAFTGAVDRRVGKFELADGSSLFLDEIGDISLAAQAKLLRALQEGEVTRVGGSKTIKVDVRVIAATNKNLTEEVKAGAFREDLLFRLKVIVLELPPLRERPDDIPALAEYFLKQLRSKFRTPVKVIAPATLDVLNNYSYPGNVRELKNIIERGLVFAQGDQLLPEHLPVEVQIESGSDPKLPAIRITPSAPLGEPVSLAEMEKRHIQYVLQHVNGNKLRAASILGISRTTLYEKLKQYGMGLEEKVARPAE